MRVPRPALACPCRRTRREELPEPSSEPLDRPGVVSTAPASLWSLLLSLSAATALRLREGPELGGDSHTAQAKAPGALRKVHLEQVHWARLGSPNEASGPS